MQNVIKIKTMTTVSHFGQPTPNNNAGSVSTKMISAVTKRNDYSSHAGMSIGQSSGIN